MFQEPRCLVAIKMPQSLKDAIDSAASQHNLSASDFMRRVLADATGATEALPVHGNTRYATSTDRAIARKRQHQKSKQRIALIKQLGV